MARRTLNRRELRDAAETAETADKTDDKKATAKKKKKKAATKSRSTSKAKKETPVGGVKLVWGVFDNSNENVATFDYPERKKADKLAAELTAKHGSSHFVKPVKEPIR